MGSMQRQVPQLAGISFIVVQNRGAYAPILVRRESFIGKVGRAAAQKTYQTTYAPKDFPSATFAGPGDAF
jgi:hypothetical protein